MQNRNSDTLFYTDCSQPNETIIKSDISLNRDTILNFPCNLFEIQTNNLAGQPYRFAYYYFNETTKVNPDWFKNTKFGSYDKIYPQTKAVPLKIIIKMEAITITMTALSIKKQKVDDKLFEIAKGVIKAPQQQ